MDLVVLEYLYGEYKGSEDKRVFIADHVIFHGDDYDGVAFLLALNESDGIELSFDGMNGLSGLITETSPLSWNASGNINVAKFLMGENALAVNSYLEENDGGLDMVYEFVQGLDLSEDDTRTIFYKTLDLAKELQEVDASKSDGLFKVIIDNYL